MDRSLATHTAAAPPRLDRALAADLRDALGRPAVLAFLALEVGAGVVIVARRGAAIVETLGLLWLGLGVLAFFAWWAGRHHAAVRQPDPVGRAGGRLLSAIIGTVGIGLATWGLAPSVGVALVLGATVGWLALAARTPAGDHLVTQLSRDPRPFLPLLALIALPHILAGAAGYSLAVVVALPSGLLQQLAYLLGFFAPLEAVLRRTDLAAITAALVFGLLHVPMDLPQAGGDLVLAIANAVVFQASIGAIACLAFTRHRAAVPIGVAHALAIA